MSSHVSSTSPRHQAVIAAAAEPVGAMTYDATKTKVTKMHEDITAYLNVPTRSENPTKTFFLEQTKGFSLGLGAVNSAARLAAMASPEHSGPFAHVANLTSVAGQAVAPFNAANGALRAMNAFKKHEYVNATQYSLDTASSTVKAATALVTDRASSVFLGTVSGVFKSLANTVDLGTSVKKFLDLREARAGIAAEKKDGATIDEDVEKGVDSAFTATALKVGSLVCAIFAGALTLLAFVFKVAVSKELLVAGAVASLAGITLRIFSELTKENAEFNVTLDPKVTKTTEKDVSMTIPNAVSATANLVGATA